MQLKQLKLNKKGKITILALLCIALVISGILLFSNDDKKIVDNQNSVQILDKKALQIGEETLLHNTKLVKVDATFAKKAVTVYTPPTSPLIGDGQKYCVLTFDDGPGVDSTRRILNVLAKYNIKGTWFVLGSRVYTYQDMAKAIVNEGHEIANHSYSHPDLSTLSYEGYMSEINKTQTAIATVTGRNAKLLRPPYGSYTSAIASNAGLAIALWNVDSLDWSHRYAPAIYSEVMGQLKQHSIILFHDIYGFTAEAVEMLVPKLVEMGYTFITYSQYLQL